MIKKRIKSYISLSFAVISIMITSNLYSLDGINNSKKDYYINDINLTNNSIEIEFTNLDDLSYKVFTLKNPDRIVIDLYRLNLKIPNKKIILPSNYKNIRASNHAEFSRIVFDLASVPTVEQSLVEKIKGARNAILKVNYKNSFILNKKVDKVEKKDNKLKILNITKPTIVIDAGHGGKDPGTIGVYLKSKEKNITLSYAKELAKKLNNTNLYKVYLTRDDDRYLTLKQRVNIARRHKADLFVSIHVNSINDSTTTGFSVYTLSEKSSDKQAEILARKENKSDIIYNINFEKANSDILKTLINMSQRDAKNRSSIFANTLIKVVKDDNIKVLQNTHRFAGFAVLTSPDVASVLVEIGYSSNKEEEIELNNLFYRKKMIKNFVDAIDKYFNENKY